jgi:hypothetical protein
MGKLVGIHRNKTSNPFKAYNSSTDYLVVGGGGGSTYADPAGGGGAGGLIYRQALSTVLKGIPVLITVGAGGAIGAVYNAPGNNGQYSVFDLDIAYGGGFGSREINAGNGGSGGGVANGSSTSYIGGSGVPGQGNSGATVGANAGGGGGGAGAAGSGRNGGNGLQVSITGVTTYYAGGGGSGYADSGVTCGGLGGGGHWRFNDSRSSGQPNTGGGAGGCSSFSSGGSGVVIVAYPNTMGQLLIDIGLVYTYSSSSRAGYHVYTFTAGTGYIVFR